MKKNGNMRKCRLFLLLCVLVLSGCQRRQADLENSNTSSGQAVSTQSAEGNEQKEHCTFVPIKEKKLRKNGLETIKGKISEIFYGNDGNLLIQAEKTMYLYNIEDKEVKAKMKIPGFRRFSVKRLDDGYAMIGEVSKSEKSGEEMSASTGSFKGKWEIQFMDSSLNIGNKIDLTELLGERGDILDSECIAITYEGKKIAVATEKGIISCDVQNGEKQRLVDLTKKLVIDHLVLDGVEQLAFTRDGKRLVFFANALPESASDGEKGVSAWGTVSLDKDEISMESDKEYYAEEMQVYDNNLILPESFEHNRSRILSVDLESGKKKLIPFSSKSEGKDGVYASSEGKYFATACLLDHSVRVRVYNMEKGRLLLEHTISDKKDEYFYRIPSIYLVDSEKTCMVALGTGMDDLETKVEQFGF